MGTLGRRERRRARGPSLRASVFTGLETVNLRDSLRLNLQSAICNL